MSENYVSKELGKLLKEKGYPQEYNVGTVCRLQNKANSLYEKTREIKQSDIDNAWCVFNEIYPILYDAQKWFREKHNLHVSADFDHVNLKWFFSYYTIGPIVLVDYISDSKYDDYESCLNAGMLDAMKII